MHSKPWRALALTVVFGAARSTSVSAYEEDFHYVLTKWLAVQVGFCNSQVSIIASATVAPDHDHDPVQLTLQGLRGNLTAAQAVQEWHFPSDGPVPGLGQARRVEPGSRAAWRKVEQVMNDSTRRSADDTLRLLGNALHPLQDSWSHQGVPAVPARLLAIVYAAPEIVGWGHPANRGGYMQTLADQTYLDPASALAAAEATYEALQRFDQVRHLAACSGNNSNRPFAVIQPEIDTFVRLDTIAAKKQWFGDRLTPTPPELAMLDRLSLRRQ